MSSAKDLAFQLRGQLIASRHSKGAYSGVAFHIRIKRRSATRTIPVSPWRPYDLMDRNAASSRRLSSKVIFRSKRVSPLSTNNS